MLIDSLRAGEESERKYIPKGGPVPEIQRIVPIDPIPQTGVYLVCDSKPDKERVRCQASVRVRTSTREQDFTTGSK